MDKMASGQLVSEVGQKHGWTSDRVKQIQGLFESHRDDLLGYGKAFASRIAAPAQHIWWLILIPILSLFFLKDGREIGSGVIGLGRAPEEKATLRGVVTDVNVMLGSYIRAQLILASLTLVAYTLVLGVLRVPYAVILGPIAGVLEFIPVVGPAVAAVSVLAIAILTGYSHTVWVVLFLGVWRLTQDYVTGPRIMGQSLEISPLAQIFAVLAGGEIAGVVGALISVPVLAILRILWRRLSDERGVDAPVTESGDLVRAGNH
jgi:predicted PurR-regulated permease PerM